MGYELRSSRCGRYVTCVSNPKPSTRDSINQRLNEIESCREYQAEIKSSNRSSHLKAVLHLAIDEEICKLMDDIIELTRKL